MEVVIIIILCPLLHLFWGRNNQCQLKRAADRQTTTDSVNKLTWWGEREWEEKQSIEEKERVRKIERGIYLFSLFILTGKQQRFPKGQPYWHPVLLKYMEVEYLTASASCQNVWQFVALQEHFFVDLIFTSRQNSSLLSLNFTSRVIVRNLIWEVLFILGLPPILAGV